MVRVSFITVTMNSVHTVGPLLESFYTNMDPGISYEYFIVDNCSTDGTQQYIQDNYPDIILIKNESIKGFAENNNIAMSYAKGEIMALINPDIVFLSDFIRPVISLMHEQRDIGLIGPKLLYANGETQNSARKFLSIRTALLRLITLGNDKVPLKSIQTYLKGYDPECKYQSVDWVIGAAMFVRKAATHNVGLMDENFFLYIEDQDWCFQMWKNNWKVGYFTKVELIHEHQRSSAKKISKKTLWHVQSILYFLWKNYIFSSKLKIKRIPK